MDLVRDHENAVFSLLWRMLAGRANAALIEDLAQETFLRAFKALPAFDPSGPAKLSTFILTIASRLAIDELRRIRPVASSEAVDAAIDFAAMANVESHTLARNLASAFGTLPPEQRETFLLFAHGATLDEIAAALVVEVGTVKSRLHRARAALKEYFDEPG